MKRLVLGILFLVVFVLPFKTAHAAAVECFLFINGVPGESADILHKEQIELQGWSVAEFNPGAMASTPGGVAGGKVQMQEFRFTTRMSKASPILFRMCASGTPLTGAILSCRKAGGGTKTPTDFLRIRLENLKVSSYQAGIPAPSAGPFPPPGIPAVAFVDGIPMDQVGLNFGAITVEFLPQSPTGLYGPPISGGFDVMKNQMK